LRPVENRPEGDMKRRGGASGKPIEERGGSTTAPKRKAQTARVPTAALEEKIADLARELKRYASSKQRPPTC
jgi:hypothetical protein